MLRLALSFEPLQMWSEEVSSRGSRFEHAVEALCGLIRGARRKQVVRRHRIREDATRSPRGQLRFPAQAVVPVQRPGFVASRWVELSEDVPENRFLKAALAHSHRHVSMDVRRQVDEVWAGFDGVLLPADPLLEYQAIRAARLPQEYLDAIELSKGILEGSAAGILSGSLASRSEVLFLPALFQGFVNRLVQGFAVARGYSYDLELRGRRLSEWTTGPHQGSKLVELIPDAELYSPLGAQPEVILDAKWKEVRPGSVGMGLSADDVHQMVAYSMRLDCRRTVLVFPWLGKEAPFSQPPLMQIGSGRSRTDLGVVCLPLLWDSVEGVSAGFAAALEVLLAS